MKMQESYDFVIAGAGPAGLTAAISAAEKGFSTLVLEQGPTAGPRPRGEGIIPHAFLYGLLGRDFFELECHWMDGSLVFHSPGNERQIRLKGKRNLCFFAWRSLINRLVNKAEALGVTIRFNSQVCAPVMNEKGLCTGLEFRAPGGGTGRAYGSAVLGCDGYKSTVGSFFGIRYDLLNCIMVKCLAEDVPQNVIGGSDLRFYLIGNSDLSYSPWFPPCVAYAFPIGGGKMELGLMLRMACAHGMKTMQPPDEGRVLEVWEHLKQDYPGFSRYFTRAKIMHEELTGMSNAGLVNDIIPAPGVVLIGDSAGFIDAFGSSGLYSGMMMADFWVTALAERMIAISGRNRDHASMQDLWSTGAIRSMKKSFQNTPIARHIRRSYLRTGIFEWYIFRLLGNSGRVNRQWKLISWLLKL